jgi:ubiquinol-cytochrome c reductase iron-sulfur subunit
MANNETPFDPSLMDDAEPTRRDVILIAAGGFAAIGAAAALWPLLDQMNPDASALSLATTEVDISHVDAGQAITVMWRGKPIFVRRRTDAEIAKAKDTPLSDLPDQLARNDNLPDDTPATAANREIKAEWLIVSGVCTHLGCTPTAFEGDYGGWLCHCHGSQYDTAGRIRKGPAPRNLQVPPYSFLSATRVKVG